jgi:hypothetical protein
LGPFIFYERGWLEQIVGGIQKKLTNKRGVVEKLQLLEVQKTKNAISDNLETPNFKISPLQPWKFN